MKLVKKYRSDILRAWNEIDKVLFLSGSLAFAFLLLGIFLKNGTAKSLSINLCSSFIAITVTIGIIEASRNRELERNLLPSRVSAITEVKDAIGNYLSGIYNSIDKSFTHPIAGRQEIKNDKEDFADYFYNTLAKVLRELNGNEDKSFIENITEIEFITFLNNIAELQKEIEKIRFKYSFGLDTKMNKRILTIENMIKPSGTAYDIRVITSPENHPIAESGVEVVSRIIKAATDTLAYVDKLKITLGNDASKL